MGVKHSLSHQGNNAYWRRLEQGAEPKIYEVTEGLRMFHNEELHNCRWTVIHKISGRLKKGG
jgi:hypothetical protein